jgi:cation:H+ antiporter
MSSVWQNTAIFALAAITIWWAGTRLERHADAIAKRTGLAQSFTGMVLLAVVTSLPEVATTFTAVLVLNNPTLAVHNLLGGVALQTAILVIADVAKPRRGALTFFAPTFALLIQGVGLLMLLQLAIAGIVLRGMPSSFSVSLWPVLIAGLYGGLLQLTYRHQGQPRWTPSARDDLPPEIRSQLAEDVGKHKSSERGAGRSTLQLWLIFAVYGGIVLGAGYVATVSAETLARETGMGDAFIGATLLALATSLPEVSTTLAASRAERYTVAVSNIFGSNAFDVALLFVAELLHRDGSLFESLQPNVVFVPAIGALMTCFYLWGLMERENRTLLRVGWDSAAAAVTYGGGMAVLYFISRS